MEHANRLFTVALTAATWIVPAIGARASSIPDTGLILPATVAATTALLVTTIAGFDQTIAIATLKG